MKGERMYGAFLRLKGRSCLVVGGGPVAERKVISLLECGADVTVIAPQGTDFIVKRAEDGTIRWEARPFQSGDATPFSLIIAATDSVEVNRQVYEEGEANGRLVNVVNDQALGNFTVPAVIRRGALSVAISTSGAAPVVAKKLREELESFLGPEIELFLDKVAEVRKRLLAEVPEVERRTLLLRKLVNSELLSMMRQGEHEDAEQLLERILEGLEE
ncbi:precorrin-2 dehydrogenase/sirohydrochlorin ferrochelatase family protein [Tumebacillus lipolyticus]